MKKIMRTLTVATGLTAVAFGAFGETAVTESHAARDVLWERAQSDAGPQVVRSENASSKSPSRAVSSQVAGPVNVWADNYAAGRVHGPAGH